MKIDIKTVITNLKNFPHYDYRAYPMSKDEAEAVIEYVEGEKDSDKVESEGSKS